MIKTIFEEGMEKGMEKERWRIAERSLLRRFKTLSDTARKRLAEYPAEKLDDLLDAAVDAASLKELGLED